MAKPLKILITLCLLHICIARAQNPHELINNYLATVSNGNVNNWKKLKTAYIESITYYNQSSLDQKVIDLKEQKNTLHKIYVQWPDKSRDDLYEDDSVRTSSFFHVGNDHFFVMGNMAPMPLSPGPYEPHFQFIPVIINNVLTKSSHVGYLGMKSIESQDFHEIKLITKDLIWHIYINPQTELVEYWNNSPDGDKSTLTKVFDYQAFDGVLIPLSEVKTKNGVVFFLSQIKKLELNKPLDPDVFRYKGK
jgi:hypothetical protein